MLVEHSATTLGLLRRHWKLIPAVLGILVLVELSNDYVGYDRPAFSIATVGLLISALSIFLAFRVNEAYSRWWEARILWGTLVNASRAFARKVVTLVGADTEDAARPAILALRKELLHRQIAFVNALRLTLRQEDTWDDLRPFLDDEEVASLTSTANKPSWLLQRQSTRLAGAHGRGWLSDAGQNQLDRTFSELDVGQGGCERIKNTPFPEGVSHATRIVAWGMATIVPIAITDSSNRFDLIDMVVVPILMLSFLLVERLGAELRNPFEGEPNDTPMTTLCRVVERDLGQALDEESLPPPLESEDGVLM